jgi:hypothetical protein
MVVLPCAIKGRLIFPLRLNVYYHMLKQFPLYFPFRLPSNTRRAAMCTRSTVLCYGCVVSELSSVVEQESRTGSTGFLYIRYLITLGSSKHASGQVSWNLNRNCIGDR